MIDISARGASDVGKQRGMNEDAIGLDEALGIFVLADGMGGHESGAVASKAAVATVHSELSAARPIFDRFRDDPTEVNRATAVGTLVMAVEKTCARVYDMGREGQTRRRMGSTLDVIVRMGDRALLAHVGDARVYLLRDGKCFCLTEDHSIVAEQLKAGIITPEEAEGSQFRGVLTRAIGTHRSVKVDTLLLDLNAGDVLVMCSDGLHRYADAAELVRILGPDATPDRVTKLVDHANACGGADNVSAILIAVREAAATNAGANGGADANARPNTDAAKTHVNAASSRAPTLSDTSTGRVSSRIDAICKLPLFQHLSYREQVAVLSVAKSRIYEEGSTIVEQGAPGQDMFIIIEGRLSVERDGLKIAELGPGGHFGEMSLVDDSPRSATVKARTRTDVLSIGQSEITALMRLDPVLGVKVLWNFVQVLSTRLRSASAEIIELQTDQRTDVGPRTTIPVPFAPQ